MLKYRCTICNYIYEEKKEDEFKNLDESWTCPVCNAPKSMFIVFEDVEDEKSDDRELKTISEIIVEQLVEWDVKYVFGIPGTSSLGIVDAIRKNSKINYYQVRHEQTASFMCSAYGKLTGKIAVCLTIAGPGATNLATGLYDAKLDNSPVFALTGQVKKESIGPGSFQEIDQEAFFKPICDFNKTIISKEQSSKLVQLALKHALVKKSVSHLSIPNDLQKEFYKDYEIIKKEGMIPTDLISPNESIIDDAVSKINASKRPVIIAGFGALIDKKNVLNLAEKISAPIVTTFKGKNIADYDYPLYVGTHGGLGTSSATSLVNNSDLLIVIASSFSDMTNIPKKPTVQIDIDPMMIGKSYPVEVGLLGNTTEIVPKLLEKLEDDKKEDYLKEISNLKKEWEELIKKEYSVKIGNEHEINTPKNGKIKSKGLRPPYIIDILSKNIPSDAILSLDVGEHTWWFGRNFPMKSTQDLLISGYLATMGFGLPGALAGQITYPDRKVICITGDGGLSMVLGDFLTAVKYELPISVFVFNNHELGMIMQEQKVERYPKWQTELLNCDFAEFANNCGGLGIKVNSPQELEPAIKQALESELPVIVDIETDPTRF